MIATNFMTLDPDPSVQTGSISKAEFVSGSEQKKSRAASLVKKCPVNEHKSSVWRFETRFWPEKAPKKGGDRKCRQIKSG